jgi:hypothetical protein
MNKKYVEDGHVILKRQYHASINISSGLLGSSRGKPHYDMEVERIAVTRMEVD